MRLIPATQKLAAGLYQAAYFLGFADGANAGFTVGLVAGVVAGVLSTVFVITLIYWSFFKQVRAR